MTVVAEKKGTPVQLIEDIASALLSNAEWTDADASIVTDNSDGTWRTNSRVLHHSGMGIYVIFTVSPAHGHVEDGYQEGVEGVVVSIAEDYDAERSFPQGRSTIRSRSSIMSDESDSSGLTDDSDSFGSHDLSNTEFVNGIMVIGSSVNLSTVRSRTVNYFISGRSDGLTVAAWNTSSTRGMSATLNLEYVDNKFWDDGVPPFAVWTKNSGSNYGEDPRETACCIYGFQYYRCRRSFNVLDFVGISPFEQSDWGYLNPAPGDDTFFFRRAVIQHDRGLKSPVAFMEDCLPNDEDTGASHGDIITHNGIDYRVFSQDPPNPRNHVTEILRYE